MCGICGILYFDERPVDQGLLARMNKTLTHRGPDDEGYYSGDAVGLCHRRLSIIDLNTGQQPIANEDDTKFIVFNGEIYNFVELREDLEKSGHLFKTKTDTEVILHAYEQWGPDCVSHLRGMFAFAIWDKKEKILYLARDRLGIKPLYYAFNRSMLVFASEIKAIVEAGFSSGKINLEAFSDYLSLGYVPAPKTIYMDVLKLLPGHYLICRDGCVSSTQYWDLEFRNDNRKSIDLFTDLIFEALEEAVRIRLVSDVPLGAFLSGGIDSSAVVAIMARLQNGPVTTNSIGFTEQDYSELDHARRTASLFHTNHHEYVVTPNLSEVLDKLFWYFDEPFSDASSIPTYYVSQMTRKNVTVALSGDGGDENFAGYRRYYYDVLENRIRRIIPGPIRRYLFGGLAAVYPKADRLPQPLRAKTLLRNISQDAARGYFNSVSGMTQEMKTNLLHPDVRSDLRGYDTVEVFRHYYSRAGSIGDLAKTQYIDFKTYLVDGILTKVDRASMANSLEVRVPLLDHKFVELIAQIPPELKLNGLQSKHIFKKTMTKLLPDEIINRKKKGFAIPMGRWFRTDLARATEEILFDDDKGGNMLLNKDYIRYIWNRHLSGENNCSQPLWTVFAYRLWARKWL